MGDVSLTGTFQFWGTWYGNIGPYWDTPSIGKHHLRGHSTSGDISSMGTHYLWVNTTTYLWGYFTYGDIPILGNMVREHRTYGDTPTIGKHHLRGHSTSGDTPSMGEYHTAYGEGHLS